MAMFAPDLFGDWVQRGGGGDVCFVEVDVGCYFVLVAEKFYIGRGTYGA